jgi:alpha-L-rhamnosidase
MLHQRPPRRRYPPCPDWTDYHQRVRYQTYDITPLLTHGDNVFGAILGDGWYSGHVGLASAPGFFGKHPAFLAQVVVDYTDGTRQVIATDNSWKVTVGPELGADTLNGTVYDARQELPGWNTPAFNDAAWSPVEPRDEQPALEAQIAQPVRRLMEFPTRTITEPKPGVQIFDLGQNMVGYARLKVRGPAGATLTLRYSEMLNPNGTLYVANLRRALAADVYTLKGGGEEIWEPRFTFHGFRYVEVTGYPGKLSPNAITGVVIGSDTPHAGTWESSNPDLNKLYSNIVWGQRGNYVSVPTDCPQRDERLGWMGDAQVFIRTATYNADVDAFFNNWLVDVMDAQHPDGAYPDMAPPTRTGSGVAAWADAGVICPWTIYQVYGDKLVLERQYTSMAAYIDYLKSHSDNLIRPAAGYGDWLSIEADTPKDLLATAYFAYSTDLMSRIATVLDKPQDAAKYRSLFEDIKKAFNEKFVTADGKVTGDTQTGYLLALKMKLVDGGKEQAAVRHLIDAIHAKNNHLSTGFVGVSYLLPMLTKYGHTDLAYRLLLQETFPSWLFSVKQGATTIWERWDGWTPDKGFQTPGMNSFNHYSLGSCGEWMFESAAGIGMGEPGYKTILIRPEIGGGLSWVKATYHSVRGEVKTEWRQTGGTVRLLVTVPMNTTAWVFLPYSGHPTSWTMDGKPVTAAMFKEYGVRNLFSDRGIPVGGGTYVFETVKSSLFR